MTTAAWFKNESWLVWLQSAMRMLDIIQRDLHIVELILKIVKH